MYTTFNTLIDGYIDNKIGIATNFLSAQLSIDLTENLKRLLTKKLLQPAGTGNEALAVHNKLFRSDAICWLDRSHHNQFENAFFDVIDLFVSHLNQTCYTGITGYEFHYAVYEKGSFYKKHLDQFKNNNSRQYTMIFYFNEGWVEADGGELCIYPDGVQQKISPDNGKTVFFKSGELSHEVLETQKVRLSITGWLKKD